jgi:hypothetical protein
MSKPLPDPSIETPPGGPPKAGVSEWRYLNALGLPSGSVRAIMGLLIFGSVWVLLATFPDVDVPSYMKGLLFLVMGHYFAHRAGTAEPVSNEPPPLFSPRGLIRIITVGGFVAVAAVLFQQGRLLPVSQHPGVVTLILVFGFLIGVLWGRISRWLRSRVTNRPKRLFEDLKAVACLLATVLLLVIVFNHYYHFINIKPGNWYDVMERRLGENGVGNLLAAFVGFYFGNRS